MKSDAGRIKASGVRWRKKDVETDGGKRRRGERRFRRVIGSAGVDAILSSIPHQPPPGNLLLLSLALPHSTPILTFRFLSPAELVSRVQRIPSKVNSKSKKIAPSCP